VGLREYLDIARRRWRLIVTPVIVGLAVTALLTIRTTPLYQSHSRLFVSTTDQSMSEALQGGNFAIQRVRSYADLVTSQEVASRVIRDLNLDLTPSELSRKITATFVDKTPILKISVTDPNPKLAQQIDQAASQELAAFVRELETPAGESNAPVKATIIDAASLPTSPVSPRPVRNLGLAGVLGLLLGIALVLVREQLDTTVKRPKDIVELSSAPVLGRILFDFEDGGLSYLARTRLLEHETPAAADGSAKKELKERWNGHDWYVSFRELPNGRQWVDAMTYGFVSAGGDKWFSRTLKNLPVGARVFACIPKAGYVGVGHVLAEARRFDEATVDIEGIEQPLADLSLVGNYRHDGDEADEFAEWAVPLQWTRAVPREQGIWKAGMFANQNSAAKLRQRFTIEQVLAAFEIEE